ncbi:MAG: hypothetical protein JOZ81_15970 [Chloroflexi bacterium]|nr:hypothetical protein [Chloroflexota bacterium]
MSATPPRHVTDAAAVVQSWLDREQAVILPPEQRAKLSDAEKLDYARKFDQSKMPANPYDTRK